MPAQIKWKLDQFLKWHFAISFVLLFMLFSALEFFRLDLWISGHFYNAELHQWIYQESRLAETVLHIGGRYFTYIAAVGMLICLLASRRSNSAFHRYRHKLAFLLVASVSGPIIIALLKSSTHIYCPWSLDLFGGDKPYVRLFDHAIGNLEIGHCFPEAHAGSGFTFVSLYFFLMAVKPEYKLYGLYVGLVLGIMFGASQQVRGAHFLSHDVFSLAVCWSSSLMLFILFFGKELKWG